MEVKIEGCILFLYAEFKSKCKYFASANDIFSLVSLIYLRSHPDPIQVNRSFAIALIRVIISHPSFGMHSGTVNFNSLIIFRKNIAEIREVGFTL